MGRGIGVVVVLCGVLGCGGGAAEGGGGGGAVPGAAGGACLPVAPMELVVLEHGSEWEPIARLLPDGTVVNKHGPVGSIAQDQFFDRAHASVFWCAPDRTLHIRARPEAIAHFDAQDRLVDPKDPGGVWVDDAGGLHAIGPGGRDMFDGKARFVGGYAGARRTAVMVYFAAMSGARWGF